MADDFPITTPNNPTWTDSGKLALAHRIADHIKRGIARGTWAILNGRVVPRAMLHFYEEEVIIESGVAEK
jgi:hypothetical protein